MNLAEAWHLSKVPYKEVVYRSIAEEKGRMWWGAFGKGRQDEEIQAEKKLIKKALRIAKFDKAIVSIFNIVVTASPFISLFQGASSWGVASSISLSLAVTFGFTLLYAIQTLSSFVSTESSALLSPLPLTKEDFSLITLFSFIRSVDYLVIGSVLSQVVIVGYLTMSPTATLITFAVSAMNSLFSVVTALWFSRFFHKNYLRGGRSKRNTVLRAIFILTWGFLLIGVSLMLTIPWYILPMLEQTLFSASQLTSVLLSFVYPFSAGLAISSVIGSYIPILTTLTAFIAILCYGAMALFSARWSLKTVNKISQGTGVKIARSAATDFKIKVQGAIGGYILKDLRISSRNPATAFFFALPLVEMAIIVFMLSEFEVLRATSMISATLMGAIFTLIVPLALLNSEGKGLEYTKTLPMDPNRMIISKAIITVATYMPVPIALSILASAKPLSNWITILIPIFIVTAVAAASIFEMNLFLKSVTKGKIAAIMNDLQKLFIGILTLSLPLIGYSIVYLLSLDHLAAIATLAGIGFLELLVSLLSILHK